MNYKTLEYLLPLGWALPLLQFICYYFPVQISSIRLHYYSKIFTDLHSLIIILILLGQKNLGRTFFGVKKIGSEIFFGQKKFGSNIFVGQKKFGSEIFWVKKNWVTNFFGQKI